MDEIIQYTDRRRSYAMHFIYSGNFIAQLEKSQFDSIRAVMGIHPADFSWKLESEEAFIHRKWHLPSPQRDLEK